MAERLHPGVYTEERKTGLAPIQGVSTSNMGIVGYTLRGPINEAVLVTSFDKFEQTFGGFTTESQVPTHVYAFFANGGRRAYVVRATPSDAVTANGYLENAITEEVLGTGDGSTTDYSTGLTITNTPIKASSVTITYYESGTPVVAEVVTPSTVPDGAATQFSFILAGKPVQGTVTITATIAAGSVLYDDAATPGILQDIGDVTRGYVDYDTGIVTLVTAAAVDAATNITADYTPLGTLQSLSDDGAGVIPAGTLLTGDGSVDYTTGAVAFVLSGTAPANATPIQVAYTFEQWDMDPISPGTWANTMTLDVRGDEDSYTQATASYSRYDVLVYLDGDLEEIYEDISLDDPTDTRYIASIVNTEGVGSDLLSLVEPSNGDLVPDSLNGKARTSIGVGGGDAAQLDFGSTDGTGSTATIPVAFRAAALETPIHPGSVTISYTDSGGTARTITDDGSGNLVGTDLDATAPAGYNVIDYATGDFAFRLITPLADATYAGSIATAAFYLDPAASSASNTFSGGTDGTAVDRAVLTSPTLLTNRQGMYALLPTNELQNVVIPDAAGNTTMSLDLITEAERNEQWFGILATTPGLSPQEAQSYRRNTLGSVSSYAALYYPYIRIADPATDLPANIPPGGHIAGVYARTDTTKSVAKAPAGVEDGRLNFSIGLERQLEFAEIDVLHPYQVNSIIDTPQTGRCVWGARTLESPPGDFKFVSVRRMFNFLKLSIFNSTHGLVFENVGPSLYSRIRLSIEGFLLILFNQGYFAGTSPADAFNVICDESNNPAEVAAAGTVICDIYVATQVPGEFIVFRIQQKVATS